ncbi:MAG: aldo/keto reductase [Acidobacteria bacterium]|nr:aldo/keto reductase [Acidobacteriota bacterium]
MPDSRRNFFQSIFGSAMAAALAQQAIAQQSGAAGLPTRKLGRTNEHVSILCLGGWHIGAVENKDEAVRIMHAAIDEGLTFFDTCWDYQWGGSEEIIGRALSQQGKRDKVFLMTKNCERDYAGSMKCLDDSLRRLKTDRLDLWQFHEMVYDNDPDWVFEKGGLRAALEAQKAGKVRYIGFTGHKDPRIHLKMLNKPYDWATAQMPINVMDGHFRSFQKEVVPVCLSKNVGVIGMKSLAGGPGPGKGRIPTETKLTHDQCRRYALSLPISSLVVGVMTMDELKAEIAIARDFKPLPDSEKENLLSMALTEGASDGRHELFKSTQTYDGPHHRQQHGFAV